MAKIALVDLDGVLDNYTGKYNEQEIPPIKDGAKDFLEELSKYYDIEIMLDYSSGRIVKLGEITPEWWID